jgi:hypothetical protein
VWLDDPLPLIGLDAPTGALTSTATMATGGNPHSLHTRTLSYHGGGQRLIITTYQQPAPDDQSLRHALLTTLAGIAHQTRAHDGPWTPTTVRVEGQPIQFLTAGPQEGTWAATGTVESTLCTIQAHNIERTAVQLRRLDPRDHLPSPERPPRKP